MTQRVICDICFKDLDMTKANSSYAFLKYIMVPDTSGGMKAQQVQHDYCHECSPEIQEYISELKKKKEVKTESGVENKNPS